MPTTSNGFPYPAASDAPDGPGVIYNLANTVDTFLIQGGWTPVLGGTGATIGSGGTVNGYFVRVGKRISYHGQIIFGTGASFGSGTPAIVGMNAGGNYIIELTVGHGWYHTSSGAAVPLLLAPSNGSQAYILVIGNGTTTAATSIGTPPATAQLHFVVDGIYA